MPQVYPFGQGPNSEMPKRVEQSSEESSVQFEEKGGADGCNSDVTAKSSSSSEAPRAHEAHVLGTDLKSAGTQKN